MNNNVEETNSVYLQGCVNDDPVLDHSVKGEDFYGFNLRVARLSGQCDYIPIILSKQMVEDGNIKQGDHLTIKGQFRSHNKLENDKRKLLLAVFAKEVERCNETENSNNIELNGYICKPVVYRTTPFSREICDVLLAVNRSFNKSDYIPCIAWGNNAKQISQFPVATPLKLVGRIQSREYNKNTGLEVVTKTAYEVSISKLLEESDNL